MVKIKIQRTRLLRAGRFCFLVVEPGARDTVMTQKVPPTALTALQSRQIVLLLRRTVPSKGHRRSQFR